MYYLTLSEITVPGGPLRQLGAVQIHQERVDRVSGVATYSLESQGQRVGSIHGWRLWHGPWRLAQAALDTIYGGIKLMSPGKLRDDGACNAVTQRGRRCRVAVQSGSYFCVVHDRLR
jgi:hypothetical protein